MSRKLGAFFCGALGIVCSIFAWVGNLEVDAIVCQNRCMFNRAEALPAILDSIGAYLVRLFLFSLILFLWLKWTERIQGPSLGTDSQVYVHVGAVAHSCTVLTYPKAEAEWHTPFKKNQFRIKCVVLVYVMFYSRLIIFGTETISRE